MQGRWLSVVQDLGLDVLQRQDTILVRERNAFDIRLARLAKGDPVGDIFPEYVAAEPADTEVAIDAAFADPEALLDYSDVQWQGAEEMQADQDLLAEFFAQDDGSVRVETDGEWV